jgi:predicted permease
MAKPAFLPQPLIKTVVSSYIELVIDVLAWATLVIFFIVGLVASFDRYYGPNQEDVLALVVIGLLAFWFFVWGIFKVIVLFQLRRQKRWAWVAALVIAGLNCFSFPYLILGIIKLIGLLNNNVITWFKGQGQTSN